MLSFESDYNNGAHPALLRHLLDHNAEQSLTYGFDRWTESAKAKIRLVANAPDAQIWFLAGGTQTNATVIDAMLQPYEGVVAVGSAHINTHEAGAVEFAGHKVITIEGNEGKMQADTLDRYLTRFFADPATDHCVYPSMVYITFPTEYGTIYTAAELDHIYKVCRKHNTPLYIDGARLGYGLMAEGGDLTLPYIAAHCDAFYIGGTKIGALCGEAVVFPRGNAHPHFFTIVKQHGALMAKGRLIGQQFDALFTDGLYFDISKHAVAMATKMKAIFNEKGYKWYIDSPTNQQFVVLDNDEMQRLSRHIHFSTWEPYDERNTVCRFVTSWATTEEEIEMLRTCVMG